MTPDTPPPKATQAREEREEREAQVNASALATCFLGSDQGKRALRYLRQRFGVDRMAFVPSNGRYDPMAAAIRDGERRVMAEVEAALKAAAPGPWSESLLS